MTFSGRPDLSPTRFEGLDFPHEKFGHFFDKLAVSGTIVIACQRDWLAEDDADSLRGGIDPGFEKLIRARAA